MYPSISCLGLRTFTLLIRIAHSVNGWRDMIGMVTKEAKDRKTSRFLVKVQNPFDLMILSLKTKDFERKTHLALYEDCK
jgi:hypothetical protein